MKNNQAGFAFIPLLLFVGFVIAGSGVGLAVKYSNHKEVPNESPTESETIVLTEIEEPTTTVVEKEDSAESNLIEDIPQRQTETASVIHSITPEPTPVYKEQVDLVTDIQVPVPIVSPTKTEDSPVKPAKNIIPETQEPEQPVLDFQKITYDQVKKESKSLTEAIGYLKERLAEVVSFQNRNLELCTSSYNDDVAQAKADAEYLKRTQNENRSGYATMPAHTQNVDNALEYDLNQLALQYDYCKSNYTVDSTIERDLNNITASQSTLIRKLTLENSTDSLDDLRTLQERLLSIADKF